LRSRLLQGHRLRFHLWPGGTWTISARRKKKAAESICKKAKKAAADGKASSMQILEKANANPVRKKSMRKAPEYKFSVTQPDNGMEL